MPRIKGNHNAMLSGKAAAEAAHARDRRRPRGRRADRLRGRGRAGPIAADLKPVRNVKPMWSKWGMFPSLAFGGLDMWINSLTGNRSPFGTLKHGKTDAEATGHADRFAPIDYPKPDGVLSFDRLTNVAFSFTNHAEDQPAHLTLQDPDSRSRSTCRGSPNRRSATARPGSTRWSATTTARTRGS